MGLGSSTTYKSMSIFDHTVQDMEGKDVALSQLRGAKAYLVVNVASK
jgi:glutathione peroxidase-family protein